MKKVLYTFVLLALMVLVPLPSMAEVNISIGISLPPPIGFKAPPEVIVLPDTNDVYVVPYIDLDLFFWNGWWWRLWEGRWYRSHYYNRGWAYYSRVPSFYFDVDPYWRRYYRDRDWRGHRWNYEVIPDRRLKQNWRSWHDNRHWEKQKTWGVRSYQPPPSRQRQEWRHQREEEYHSRPEVRRHQEEMRERRQGKPEHEKSHGKHKGGHEEHR